MKKLTFLMAILFASAVVFGQNTATIDQSGGDNNDTYTTQIGDDNLIYIKQVVANSTGYNEAGLYDGTSTPVVDNPIYQRGDNIIARLSQEVVNIHTSNQFNLAKIHQDGEYNKLIGATEYGLLAGDGSTAKQISEFRSNTLNLKQYGGKGNVVGLYQHAKWETVFGSTNADIEQKGKDNELVVYQNTAHGGAYTGAYIQAGSRQYGENNVARIVQTAGGGHQKVGIDQFGDYNKIVGVDQWGNIQEGASAKQNTGSALGGRSNTLDVWQAGGENKLGLYQHSTGIDNSTNEAYVDQYGGQNSIAAYQTTTAGNSFLDVWQAGGNDKLTVIQTTGGSNSAIHIQ